MCYPPFTLIWKGLANSIAFSSAMTNNITWYKAICTQGDFQYSGRFPALRGAKPSSGRVLAWLHARLRGRSSRVARRSVMGVARPSGFGEIDTKVLRSPADAMLRPSTVSPSCIRLRDDAGNPADFVCNLRGYSGGCRMFSGSYNLVQSNTILY